MWHYSVLTDPVRKEKNVGGTWECKELLLSELIMNAAACARSPPSNPYLLYLSTVAAYAWHDKQLPMDDFKEIAALINEWGKGASLTWAIRVHQWTNKYLVSYRGNEWGCWRNVPVVGHQWPSNYYCVCSFCHAECQVYKEIVVFWLVFLHVLKVEEVLPEPEYTKPSNKSIILEHCTTN